MSKDFIFMSVYNRPPLVLAYTLRALSKGNLTDTRLGSVVTNNGYSDWATTDIAGCECIWYRLSRRGPDFLLEYSSNGLAFRQDGVREKRGRRNLASIEIGAEPESQDAMTTLEFERAFEAWWEQPASSVLQQDKPRQLSIMFVRPELDALVAPPGDSPGASQ